MKGIILTLTLVVLLAGCQGGTWSVAGGGNYETTQIVGMFSPDPNGGVGLMLMTDSSIPDDTEDNVAIGPILEFDLGDVVMEAADRVLPGPWQPPADVPVQLFGTLACLRETHTTDWLFLPGTELRWLLNENIGLYSKVEWLTPEGNSGLEDDVKTTFGLRWAFK